MDEIIHLIQQVGFPIFVAVLLLLRVDTMHSENLKAIHALTASVNALILLLGSARLQLPTGDV